MAAGRSEVGDQRLELPAAVMFRAVMARWGAVMRGMVMPTLGGIQFLLQQRPAAAVPHDLFVGHAVAATDRPL